MLYPVKVLYEDKPLPHAYLNATFEGFPEGKDLRIITDNEGVGQIKLPEKGRWLVTFMHEVPYPDPSVCDKYRYTYSLTFEVE